uniref:Uncharacterized protein n=1 Tax=Timema cristinae TaxID=61476 RepID=A0A7R9H645_TIMCR|nr:unnamed protein product [Timema cristinae]
MTSRVLFPRPHGCRQGGGRMSQPSNRRLKWHDQSGSKRGQDTGLEDGRQAMMHLRKNMIIKAGPRQWWEKEVVEYA